MTILIPVKFIWKQIFDENIFLTFPVLVMAVKPLLSQLRFFFSLIASIYFILDKKRSITSLIVQLQLNHGFQTTIKPDNDVIGHRYQGPGWLPGNTFLWINNESCNLVMFFLTSCSCSITYNRSAVPLWQLCHYLPCLERVRTWLQDDVLFQIFSLDWSAACSLQMVDIRSRQLYLSLIHPVWRL